MKTAFFIFLLGAAAGAFGYYYFQEKQTPHAAPTHPAASSPATEPTASTSRTSSTGERVREEARALGDNVANKLTDWHLTPDEIGAELKHTGQIVRTKAQAAGESIAGTTANARIVTVIKTKYALDQELSTRAITVACEEGNVTLQGKIASTALIAKAVGIALDTNGVTHVKSLLTVTPDQ